MYFRAYRFICIWTNPLYFITCTVCVTLKDIFIRLPWNWLFTVWLRNTCVGFPEKKIWFLIIITIHYHYFYMELHRKSSSSVSESIDYILVNLEKDVVTKSIFSRGISAWFQVISSGFQWFRAQESRTSVSMLELDFY